MNAQPTLFQYAAERAFEHAKLIAASGMAGCRKARKVLKAGTVNGLKMALGK